MSKIYFHRTAGAKFYMPDGKEICFAGGFFDTKMVPNETDRVAAERELDRIANAPASHVYTLDSAPMGKEEIEPLKEILASATTGFDQVNKVPQGTTTIPMPTQQDTKPTLNPASSSVSQVATGTSEQQQQPQQSQQNANVVSVEDRLAAARAAISSSGTAANAGASNSPTK